MGKILGLDYGKSKIGLALADEQLKIALPYKTIKNKGVFFISRIKKNL